MVLGDLTLEFLTPNVNTPSYPQEVHIIKKISTERFMFLTIKVRGGGLCDFLDHII
jgi:hypothetical protein